MRIADHCRSLACKQYALSMNPMLPPARRAGLIVVAAWNEQMADEMDKLSPVTATGADLDNLTRAIFGEVLSRDEAMRRLAS
jgi:hypothetical protein